MERSPNFETAKKASFMRVYNCQNRQNNVWKEHLSYEQNGEQNSNLNHNPDFASNQNASLTPRERKVTVLYRWYFLFWSDFDSFIFKY